MSGTQVRQTPLSFLGSSKTDLKGFPVKARREAGAELFALACGMQPSDWELMSSIAPDLCLARIPKEIAGDGKARLGHSRQTVQRASTELNMTVRDEAIGQEFEDVWAASKDDPADVANLRICSEPMISIEQVV